MDNTLFKKLICINCYKSSLCEEQKALICSSCGEKIPLYNGMPNFLSSSDIKQLSWNVENSDPDGYNLTISQMDPLRLQRIDKPLLQYVRGDTLEIGCGTCRLAEPVEKRGARYFGLDPAISFLLYAYNHRNLQRLVCGRGERLPFQDKSFDCIISGFYAYRYVNSELGLPEARRVLKPGGKFIFDLLNYWILKLIKLKGCFRNGNWKEFRYFLKPPLNDFFDFINLSQLEQKVKKAGFLIIEEVVSTPITPIFPILNKYLGNFYFRGKKTVYLGYDVIIVLKRV